MKNFWAYISIIASMIFWSFSFIWSKEALATYGPLTILLFRLSIATLVLLSFSKLIGKLQKIEKGDWKYFFLLAFLDPFLYFIGETYGLQRVSATVAAVIIATIPLFLPYVAWYYFKERITSYKVYGTFLSFAGVILVIINNNMGLSADIFGVTLLLIAVFAAVAYIVVLKKLAIKYNAFTIVSWQNALALIGFGPLFFTFEWSQFQEVGLVWAGFRPIILLGIIASILAFILYTHSIKILGITRTGVFANMIPVFTGLWSFFLFSEILLSINYIGIAVVVGGLFLSQVKTKQ